MGAVLVVEPSRLLQSVHGSELRAAGHEVVAVADVVAALTALRDRRFDAVVSAVDLPAPGGYGLLRAVRADRDLAALVFAFVTTHEPAIVRAATGRDWVDAIVPKGQPGALAGALRAADRGGRAAGGRVLVVDDSPLARRLVADALADAGMEVEIAGRADEAIDLAIRAAPDVVVLDIDLPQADGFTLLERLRDRPATAELPVVFLTSMDGIGHLERAFVDGADDFVRKAQDPRELVARLRRILDRRWATRRAARREIELTQDANVDALTALATRGHAEHLLAATAGECRSRGREMALALLDVDHFKTVNDHHGHEAGDAVLRALGERLLGALGGGDFAARWGGEELLLAFPGASLTDAAARVDRLREEVARAPVPTLAGPVDVTFSAGVAAVHDDTAAAIGAADRALYRAKRAGRDRVLVAPAPAASNREFPRMEPNDSLFGAGRVRLREAGRAGS
ncbi:hypothetical protein C7Y72_06650 [Paraconexibacter algicola]|uniref:Diguanylate cyclase n=1 Tax=Paraconexibacter algicola TaxID=2133960 RepID=A0A2T4UJD4_9ACTN|nr:hypothetical protein C7Y72_06650 [Paraconexibacter algicola]